MPGGSFGAHKTQRCCLHRLHHFRNPGIRLGINRQLFQYTLHVRPLGLLLCFRLIGFRTVGLIIYPSHVLLQDPETFAASHDRRLFDDMHKAWREMGLHHPTLAED